MEKSFEHSKHGTIIYKESVWTGAKFIYIKGTPLRKVSAKAGMSGHFVGRIKGAKYRFDLQYLTWDFSRYSVSGEVPR